MRNKREAIKQAYIDTVRSVHILDDRYPEYGTLGESHDSRYDLESAVRIWRGFRAEDRACNISSARTSISDSYLERTDLLILDYELDLDDQGYKGRTARDTLRTLATTTRQNMVIVYTAEDNLLEVKMQIATSLTGLPHYEEMNEEEQEDFKEWKRENESDLDYSQLFSYLQNSGTSPLSRFEEGRIRQRLHDYVMQDGKQITGRLQVSKSQPHWIRIGSVFVTLLTKSGTHTAADLLNHLTDSLENWDPSFMRIMLAYARAEIVDHGISGDDRVLRDDETEAALMYYTDESVDIDERRDRLTVLHSRLVDDLLSGNLERVLSFSTRHGIKDLPSPPKSSAKTILVEILKRLELPTGKDVQQQVVHKINHYLAFDRKISTFVRAGTVFRDEYGEYGIVTTPDCDLVPGRTRKHGDGPQLGKFFRVVYRPGSMVADTKDRKSAYKRASNFDHMFLHVPKNHIDAPGTQHSVADQYVVIRLYNFDRSDPEGTRIQHPPTRVLYVANEGHVVDGHFVGHRIHSESNIAVGPACRFKVVGQLRDRYALRLLHDAGHHLSRTGVDFVPWDD